MLAHEHDLSSAPIPHGPIVTILALHYVEDFVGVVRSVWNWLQSLGEFVMIVEHPVATAPDPWQGYTTDEAGVEQAWLLTHYFDEGKREVEWYIPGVLKYHRRIDTMMNALIAQGFVIEQVLEPAPAPLIVVEHPRSRGDSIRPAVLAVRALKPAADIASPS